MARKAIKKAIRKVTKRVTKKREPKKPTLSQAAKEILSWRSDLYIADVMGQIENLVQATAMNGGVLADHATRMAGIAASLEDAFGKAQ